MESRRFADTICGVVHQPRQFSYSKTAAVRTQSKNWRTAVAIASIAREERWQEIAPDALFFHTNYVAPSWRQRSEEHTSELQSLMRISYAVFCLKKKKK